LYGKNDITTTKQEFLFEGSRFQVFMFFHLHLIELKYPILCLKKSKILFLLFMQTKDWKIKI